MKMFTMRRGWGALFVLTAATATACGGDDDGGGSGGTSSGGTSSGGTSSGGTSSGGTSSGGTSSGGTSSGGTSSGGTSSGGTAGAGGGGAGGTSSGGAAGAGGGGTGGTGTGGTGTGGTGTGGTGTGGTGTGGGGTGGTGTGGTGTGGTGTGGTGTGGSAAAAYANLSFTPVDIAVDDAGIYLAATAGGVKKVTKTGATVTDLISGSTCSKVAVTGGKVFAACGTTITSAPVGGGASATFASETASAITADATTVYWVTSTGAVKKLVATGGTPTPLGTVTDGFSPQIAVNANAVFVELNNGQLGSIPIAGGSTTSLAPAMEGGGELVVDATNFYVGRVYTFIYSAPAAGGGSLTEFWGSLLNNKAFTADSTHLFALTAQSGQLNAVKRAKSGGAVAQVGQIAVTGNISSNLVAVDGANTWLTVTQATTTNLYKLGK